MPTIKFIFILLFLQACRPNNFYPVVNKYFLQIADTVAYNYNSLMLPADKLQNNMPKLKIFTKVEASESLKNYAEEKYPKENFLLSRSITTFNTAKIKNSGRYKLIETSSLALPMDSGYVGTLVFYQPLISDNIMLIAYDKLVYPKGGRQEVSIFKKQKANWVYETAQVLAYY